MDLRQEWGERFEARFIPEPNSGCWLWVGSVNPKDGYGAFAPAHSVVIRAHRAAWQIYRGPIPSGLYVLHKCDVRICVNPDHLGLGTHLDNMRDMDRKGRRAVLRGDASPQFGSRHVSRTAPEKII